MGWSRISYEPTRIRGIPAMKYYRIHVKYQLFIVFSLFLMLVSLGCVNRPDSARGFLEHVYSQYTGVGPQTLGNDAPNFFASELLDLIREDQQKSQGEAGLLDYDPICNCQDFNDLKITKIQITPIGNDRAKAIVNFVNGGSLVEVGFLLIRESGQWRIHDIEEPHIPSLKRFLEDGLKETTPSSR